MVLSNQNYILVVGHGTQKAGDAQGQLEELLSSKRWPIIHTTSLDEAQLKVREERIATVVMWQGAEFSGRLDLLRYAKKYFGIPGIFVATSAKKSQAETVKLAINNGGVISIFIEPLEVQALSDCIDHAVFTFQNKRHQEELLKEAARQYRKLEEVTEGLERIVAERTSRIEKSKIEAGRKLSKMRQLVRFIKDLSSLVTAEDLMKLLKNEVRSFHRVSAPMLCLCSVERRLEIHSFQGSVILEKIVHQPWKTSLGIRVNDHGDQSYLANQFGRPFAHVIAIPMKTKNLWLAQDLDLKNHKTGPLAPTLFFEHSLSELERPDFIDFIGNRLESLAMALERLLLESHLKHASFQWEKTFNGIDDPIGIVDGRYNLLRSNEHFSLVGGRCHEVFGGTATPCRGCPMQRAFEEGSVQHGQIKVGQKLFEVYSYPIKEVRGARSTTVVNHYLDITHDRQLHERLIQNDKMAALGLLAGNVAHELNNPLTGIRSLAQLIQEDMPPDSVLKSDLGEVEKAAARCQVIIKNFLDFSHGAKEDQQSIISLNELVERTLPLVKTAMRYHHRQVHCTDQKVLVKAEPHLLQQVIFNLINNACQAMEEPGIVKIETKTTGKWAEFIVTDEGKGVSEEIIENIFEPFFTTKEEGVGTGLGLSISRSIVENLGGTISVRNVPKGGSQFVVRLPIVERLI